MVHYTDRSFVYALLGICGAVLVNLILRLYTARMAFYQKVKQGLVSKISRGQQLSITIKNLTNSPANAKMESNLRPLASPQRCI